VAVASPAIFFLQYMMNNALVEFADDLPSLQKTYLSLLASSPCALVSAALFDLGQVTEVFLVLGASEYGVLTWIANYHELDGDIKIIVPTENGLGSLCQVCITDITMYRAIPVTARPLPAVLSQHTLPAQQLSLLGSIVIVAVDSPVPLIEFAAITAFAGLSVYFLSKLVTLINCEYTPPKPTGLEDLLELLIRHTFPSMDLSTVKGIIQQRCKKPETLGTIINDEVAELAAGLMPDNDDREVFRKVAKREKVNAGDLASRKPALDEPPDEPPAQPPSGPGGPPGGLQKDTSCSGGDGPPAPPAVAVGVPFGEPVGPHEAVAQIRRSRPEPRLEARMYTAVEARMFCPKYKGSTISIQQETRWEIKYRAKPCPPYSHSETWGGREGLSHFAALSLCLRWAWDVHESLGRGSCPWDLEAEGALFGT
jgi:hypothetical protein